MMFAAALLSCTVARVYDGDTLRCRDGVALRLAAIDAPEISCRKRRCAPGNPAASRDALRQAAGRLVRYRVVDANLCQPGFQSTDPYGRLVARVYAGGRDLSRAQIRAGMAIPWARRCR
jgi:endonuclease YncB( thermonuclease family)